jgi:hypothetical protein
LAVSSLAAINQAAAIQEIAVARDLAPSPVAAALVE